MLRVYVDVNKKDLGKAESGSHLIGLKRYGCLTAFFTDNSRRSCAPTQTRRSSLDRCLVDGPAHLYRLPGSHLYPLLLLPTYHGFTRPRKPCSYRSLLNSRAHVRTVQSTRSIHNVTVNIGRKQGSDT